MKPIVVGQYYVDNYIAIIITKTLVNITSFDCSKVCIFLLVIFHSIIYYIHLKDDHKRKINQTKEDRYFDYPIYFDSFQTRTSATVNNLKYIIYI